MVDAMTPDSVEISALKDEPQEQLNPRVDGLPVEIVGRVLMTAGCTDTDNIPKVDDAGLISRRGETAVQTMHNGLVVEAAVTSTTG
jgi:hypothetical protein